MRVNDSKNTNENTNNNNNENNNENKYHLQLRIVTVIIKRIAIIEVIRMIIICISIGIGTNHSWNQQSKIN